MQTILKRTKTMLLNWLKKWRTSVSRRMSTLSFAIF